MAAAAVGLAASSPQPAEAQTADPLRELAQRLLGTPFGTPAGQSPTVQLLPGQLPNDLPLTVLQPAGTRVVGSMVRGAGGKPAMEEVVLDVPGDSTSVSGVYEKDVMAKGWKPPSNAPGQQHGFVSTPPVTNHTFCQSGSGPWLNLSVYGKTGAPNDVRLTINTTPGPCANPAPAAAPAAGSPGMNLIPALHPPDGVSIQMNGGGGGGGRWASDATATTDQTPGALEGHFAQQLQAAGWTRLGGHDDGQLSWSSWKVPGDDDWQGLLYVIQGPGQNRRLLEVRVDSATANGSSGASFVTGTAGRRGFSRCSPSGCRCRPSTGRKRARGACPSGRRPSTLVCTSDRNAKRGACQAVAESAWQVMCSRPAQRLRIHHRNRIGGHSYWKGMAHFLRQVAGRGS